MGTDRTATGARDVGRRLGDQLYYYLLDPQAPVDAFNAYGDWTDRNIAPWTRPVERGLETGGRAALDFLTAGNRVPAGAGPLYYGADFIAGMLGEPGAGTHDSGPTSAASAFRPSAPIPGVDFTPDGPPLGGPSVPSTAPAPSGDTGFYPLPPEMQGIGGLDSSRSWSAAFGGGGPGAPTLPHIDVEAIKRTYPQSAPQRPIDTTPIDYGAEASKLEAQRPTAPTEADWKKYLLRMALGGLVGGGLGGGGGAIAGIARGGGFK